MVTNGETGRHEGAEPAGGVDWGVVRFYLPPFLLMIGIAVLLLPDTIASHMASEVWVTICSAFGFK